MSIIKVFHCLALFLTMLYGVLAYHVLALQSLIYWTCWLIYLGLIWGAMQDKKWCLQILILPPFLLFAFTTPLIIYNLYLFLTGHPVYLDSPATIIIVGIVAFFLTVPASLILIMYWLQRKNIFTK